MKPGDKVKVLVGKHAGKIGVVKSTRDFTIDVELPKLERWAFFTKSEVQVVPPVPSPAENVNLMVRVAAQRVVNSWRRGMQPPIIEIDIQNLERALLN